MKLLTMKIAGGVRLLCDHSKQLHVVMFTTFLVTLVPLILSSVHHLPHTTEATMDVQTNHIHYLKKTLDGLQHELHMGMVDGSSKFAIERRTVNEATFLCPDELGWQPKKRPIIQEDGAITRIRETSCSIDAILEFLEKIKCYDAMISDDAGSFMCNYVYYHSLFFAEQKGHKSLFLHVPPFSRINKETQMQFMVALFEAIASTC